MTAERKLAALREAVQRVLDDEESGESGWGPDVTMVTVLREAMEAAAPEPGPPHRCSRCTGSGTVCECHPGRAWGGMCCARPLAGSGCREILCEHGACHCGGAGEPCPSCQSDAYRGVIVIEWPAPIGTGPYSSMTGRKVAVTDAVTGEPIWGVSGLAVYAGPESLVTADLAMLADANGEPLLDGEPVIDGAGFRTGVFTFLVSEMRVAGR